MRTAGLGKRLLLIPLGIVLALVVLEAGLQLGALAVRLSGQRLPMPQALGGRRVLCVGDSNTYGLWLSDRAQAYPQQLEQMWNTAVAAPRREVLNLGYPGTNSSRLRRDLPRMLETVRPDVVIVMVGSNDVWTAPVPVAEPDNLPGKVVQVLQRSSRVYQLVYMLRRALDRRRVAVNYPVEQDGGSSGSIRYGDVEFAMGWTPSPRRIDHDQQMQANLRAIAEEVRAFGAEPVFMTYPSRMWNYGDAGRLIRATSTADGIRLIDLAAVFAPVCPSEPCLDWLFADHHPTARGYHLVAETIVRELRENL